MDQGLSVRDLSSSGKDPSMGIGVPHSPFVDLSLALMNSGLGFEDLGMDIKSLGLAFVDPSRGTKEVGLGIGLSSSASWT